MSDPSSSSTGGFHHRLPLYIQEGITFEAVQVNSLPWGSASHVAMVGHEGSDESAPTLAIAYEWPVSWLQSNNPISAFDLEWLHVQRFRTDYLLSLGENVFSSVQRGADPPDISATLPNGKVIGIECTRLALPLRQQAHGLFRVIRDRISRADPARFASLAGTITYLWFDEGGSMSLPFGRSQGEYADELLDTLARYRPDPASQWSAFSSVQNPGPPVPLQRTPRGAAFYCVPLTNAVPDSQFFSSAGFELGLAFTTTHRASHEWATLAERVLKKDRPGSDLLLISAGAPDNRGMTYPSEDAVAEFLIDHVFPLPKLQHLKKVTIHLWGSGRAVDIFPEVANVYGPLYKGTTPGYRSFTGPTV